MKTAILTAMASLLFAGGAIGQVIQGAPSISVNGYATLEVVPDLFPVSLALEETSEDVAAAQSVIEGLAARIVAVTDEMKIPPGDISVGGLRIEPQSDFDETTRRDVFRGNSYSREIHIRFRRIEDVANFISKLPAARQLQVKTETFGYSKTDEVRRLLLADAIRNAKSSADEMARAVGRSIGGVHSVVNKPISMNVSGTHYRVGMTANSGGGSRLAPGSVRLSPGVIVFSQEVNIVYRLSE